MLDNGAHVLCCSHDTDGWQVLTTILPRLKLTFAESFAAGLQLIRSGIFDLYLLDARLPDYSGIELCREIRMTDANTPVVVLSTGGQACDQAAAFAAGATRYLDLPGDFFLLESTVIGLLSRAEARSLHARMAEIAAIRDEVSRHLEALDDRLDKTAETTISGINYLLRARAYAAFIHSGGVRSHFDRLWNEVIGEPHEDL